MNDYMGELASLTQDYALELSEAALENPELLYSSADVNGPGFSVVSAGFALVAGCILG